jgi:uncharacterized protein (DUF58 family)
MAAGARDDIFDERFLSRLQRLHLIAKRLAARGHPGGRRSRRIGDGLEFADHRPYAAGDDIRFIDWPYYARMEKLLLRLFHEHSEAEVSVLLDASGSMAPGGRREKFDYARRVAAALAFVAMGSLDRVAVVPFGPRLGEPVRAGRNRARIVAVIDFLRGLRAGGRTNLAECIERFAAGAPGGTVMVVSDLLDCGKQLSDALGRLQVRQCEVTVLHVFSPDDASPDLAGPMLLEQAEGEGRVSLDVTADLRESYRRRWEEFRHGCQRTCLGRGAVYVAAPTDVPFEQLVLGTLRRVGVVAG